MVPAAVWTLLNGGKPMPLFGGELQQGTVTEIATMVLTQRSPTSAQKLQAVNAILTANTVCDVPDVRTGALQIGARPRMRGRGA